MLDVERLAVSRLVDFAPFQCHHVAIPQPGEAGEQKRLFHDVVPTRYGNERTKFLNGQELAHGVQLLRLFLCLQQLERVAVYQTFAYGFVQSGGKAVHEDAAGGAAQRLFALVERAGFQKGDEALAKILVNLFKGEGRLTYI